MGEEEANEGAKGGRRRDLGWKTSEVCWVSGEWMKS